MMRSGRRACGLRCIRVLAEFASPPAAASVFGANARILRLFDHVDYVVERLGPEENVARARPRS